MAKTCEATSGRLEAVARDQDLGVAVFDGFRRYPGSENDDGNETVFGPERWPNRPHLSKGRIGQPALLAHTENTTSNTTTERLYNHFKVPRGCFHTRPHRRAATTASLQAANATAAESAGRWIRPPRGDDRFLRLVGGTVSPQKGRSRHERVLDVRSELLYTHTGEPRHINGKRNTCW